MRMLHFAKRPLITAFITLMMSGLVHAAGEVTGVTVSEKPATPFRYDLDGVSYTWGLGNNQLLEGVAVGGYGYSYAASADRVELRRDDIDGVSTGTPCGVFAERFGARSDVLNPDYPNDNSGSGNCDMAVMLASRVINRGALDIFSNKVPNPKNVERVDYLFDTGVSAPFDSSAMVQAGHLVAEKRGNNPIQIAAVLTLDVFGQPASYGPLVRVNESGCGADSICYGTTSLQHNYTFFQSNSSAPQGFPLFLKDSTESPAMAFVSARDLGLNEGQRYFGFSYFPQDVDGSAHTLTDPSSFPDDTADDYIVPGDGADIYGGLSGYFVGDDLNTANGQVFKDENINGAADENEAGISSISMSLFIDSNSNGVYDLGVDAQVGDPLESDINGKYTLPGIADGSYFLLLTEDDADIPPGLVLPSGSNPALFQIAGTDAPDINFGFISSSSGDGSDTAGGTTAGGDTSGGDTSGGDTAGGDTAGGDTAGGDTAGGDTAGGDTAGGDTGAPGADDVTRANPDIAVVEQGKSVLIDVLANDTDASGAGLTIVSVSDSPNASIIVTDGQNMQISYTPNADFYGLDSFLYVMQDGDGNQDTGTVNVQVDRFSDINRNNVNDFDECNCTNLTLETGVHGSGLGRMPIEILLLLGLAVLLRLRTARSIGAAL